MSATFHRSAPAAERNKEPIRAVLAGILPPRGLVLEIASGTGQHAVHFARAFPGLDWQPSDPDPEACAAIAARVAEAGLANLRPPVRLDACHHQWPVGRADAVLCINMIHIAPWSAAEGLAAGAARVLDSGGVLFLYGPFRRGGRHTAPSNAAFDEALRSQDPRWGVRDLEHFTALAQEHGFVPQDVIEMPANNLSIIYGRGVSEGGSAVPVSE